MPDGDGEDDNPPIIIERTKKRTNAPISNSMVVLYNGSDTLQGVTDANGEYLFRLPANGYGAWNLQVQHDDYHTVSEIIYITQPITERTDSLDLK